MDSNSETCRPSGFIEPDDRSETFKDWLDEQFKEGRVALFDRAVITSCFAPLLEVEVEKDPVIEKICEVHLKIFFSHAPADQFGGNSQLAALVGQVFALIVSYSTRPSPEERRTVAKIRQVLHNLIQHAPIDWLKLLSNWAPGWGQREDFARELVSCDFDFTSLIDWPSSLPTGEWRACPNVASEMDKPDSLVFWLCREAALGEGVRVTKVFRRMESRIAAHVADKDWRSIYGILWSVERAMVLALHGDQFSEGWVPFAEGLRFLFERTDALAPETSEDRHVLFLWYRLATRLFGWQYGMGAGEVPIAIERRLFESAREQFGRFRKELRLGQDQLDWIFYGEALDALYLFAPEAWSAMKPVLLAFRELRVASVAEDLRYFPDASKERPPEPWSRIPTWFAFLCSAHHLAHEREHEPDLISLRTAFSQFCLDRLKTRTVDADVKKPEPAASAPVEPDAHWRVAFIRAAQELRVNPRGKSHLLVRWVAEHDPDERVRHHAKSLYVTLRSHPKLEPKVSPRRCLLGAFWWLRQAHLLSLDVKPDAEGAQRTRQKELRRANRDDRVL